MGCLTVLKGKKKKADHSVCIKRVLPQESTPTALPEPQVPSHALQSAPPSFRSRGQPVQPTIKLTNNRMRALSAPSSFHGPDRESLTTGCEDRGELKPHVVLPQEQRSPPSPQPLPLPSPHFSGSLKSTGSFKIGNFSGPLYASGPLPLPPSGALRNFSHEEISSACHNFSTESCTSESLSSTNFLASFRDISFSGKMIEATITRFYPSTQVICKFLLLHCIL